jgi:hypothetical protein
MPKTGKNVPKPQKDQKRGLNIFGWRGLIEIITGRPAQRRFFVCGRPAEFFELQKIVRPNITYLIALRMTPGNQAIQWASPINTCTYRRHGACVRRDMLGPHVHVTAAVGEAELRQWAEEVGVDVGWARGGGGPGGAGLEPGVVQVRRACGATQRVEGFRVLHKFGGGALLAAGGGARGRA